MIGAAPVVLNIRDLGRIGTWPADVRRIDRRSPYGNPFRITTGDCTHPDCGPDSHPPVTREKAIAAYRRWLVGMLRVDPAFLEPLRGFRLACWCSPLACHGDVIAEILYGLPCPDCGVPARDAVQLAHHRALSHGIDDGWLERMAVRG